MNFKFGDKVKSINFPHWGIGTVIEIRSYKESKVPQNRPIVVKYPNSVMNYSYCADGSQGNEIRIRHLTKLEQALT